MIDVLSAFGLSSSAGLNAYLPLLIAGLTARFTNLFTLSEPWDALTNGWVLAVLGILTVIEMTVDKIPVVDSINDGIQTVIRPAAGALLFAASSNAINDLHPALGLILGLVTAGAVHGTKVVARPLVTGATGGAGNAPVSFAEDAMSATTAFAAMALPILGAILAVGLFAPAIWFFNFKRRRKARRRAKLTADTSSARQS